ncbi:hypothetical protein [Brachybacterium sp.]|uniref:hypothetical protein n=1 Tax=Brachybacterium sp. TaxID=1891286 RepID=UPI002ED00DE3
MYARKIRPGLVAALVEHLPAACAVGRELGGANAVTEEFQALAQVDLTIRQLGWSLSGKKGDKPKAWELPVGKREREAREARNTEAKKRYHARVAEREAREQSGERMTLRDL